MLPTIENFFGGLAADPWFIIRTLLFIMLHVLCNIINNRCKRDMITFASVVCLIGAVVPIILRLTGGYYWGIRLALSLILLIVYVGLLLSILKATEALQEAIDGENFPAVIMEVLSQGPTVSLVMLIIFCVLIWF